jgi:hypothetical protein
LPWADLAAYVWFGFAQEAGVAVTLVARLLLAVVTVARLMLLPA